MLVFVRLVFNTFYRMIYPFLSYFAKGLGVDLKTISYAITMRSLMGLIGPFLASVADSRGRKTGMIIGTIAYTTAISLIALWPTYTAFFIALSLAFIGYLIFVPSMQAYLGDQVPYEKRARVLGDNRVCLVFERHHWGAIGRFTHRQARLAGTLPTDCFAWGTYRACPGLDVTQRPGASGG